MLEIISIKIINNILTDMKACNIKVIDVSDKNYIADSIILCTANSTVHSNAITNKIRKKIKKISKFFLKIEGQDYKEWIIIDVGSIIIHVMLQDIREYYNIENIWLNNN